MSYQYVRAVGVYIGGNTGEQVVNLPGIITRNYASLFSKLQIVYYDTLYQKNYVIRLEDYNYDFSNFTGDIVAWFASKEGLVIDGDSDLPGETPKFVKARDMQYANYRLSPGDSQRAADVQPILFPETSPDIRITHATLSKDWKSVVKSALFTLNGHFIRGLGLNDALYLQGGGKNYRVNDASEVNCLDFTGVTTLSTDFFSEDQITVVNENGYQGLNLSFKEDLTDKQVWVVIAGRLYMGDPMVVRTGDRSCRLDLRQADFVNRLFESMQYIDLSDVLNQKQRTLSADKPLSEDFLKALLLNTNSFYIVFDTPNISVTIEPLETFRFPSTFMAHDTYLYPLMLNNGLFPSYRPRKQGRIMMMDVSIRYKPVALNNTTGVANRGNLYHSYVSNYDPRRAVKGYLFKIYTLQ